MAEEKKLTNTQLTKINKNDSFTKDHHSQNQQKLNEHVTLRAQSTANPQEALASLGPKSNEKPSNPEKKCS
ncbi:MAG: hypothetical protein IOC64_13960 [Methylobacterium sp.]|jgi:hypothetical protein|nr:hypothetical protein [Methylobacterium sp.]MCA3607820.1 hypothetical protein [Methylobacterium sp.]MCA3609128.1 hypothetical protein [Methylobacterium sp.]MCA3617560.1 hypothetical protein [Methylobacterium sp.]MCA3620003.1 hypothetical protein [Methylobacterium sp.]